VAIQGFRNLLRRQEVRDVLAVLGALSMLIEVLILLTALLISTSETEAWLSHMSSGPYFVVFGLLPHYYRGT